MTNIKNKAEMNKMMKVSKKNEITKEKVNKNKTKKWKRITLIKKMNETNKVNKKKTGMKVEDDVKRGKKRIKEKR